MRNASLLALAALVLPGLAPAYLMFEAEQLVEAGSGPIEVIAYSVPDWFDWNGDQLPDLIVGEGGGVNAGKVRVYLNQGGPSAPLFDAFFYVQTTAGDLSYPGG